MIEVFAVESKVGVLVGWTEEPMHGHVVEINIGPNNHIQYKVVWWTEDGNRRLEWVEAFEVVANDQSNKTQIGFKK